MHDVVWFNGELHQASDVNISAAGSSALYGKGIFTTIAVRDGKPLLWAKHWRRIKNDADKLKIDLDPFSENVVSDAVDELIRANEVGNGRARITFFDESSSRVWPFETDRRTSLLITTGAMRSASSIFQLGVSPYRINSQSPLAGVKSCNYLERVMASEEARKGGFDEAVMLNERGEIVSAVMANLFWLKGGELYTPSLMTGCLSGTTREFVLEKLVVREIEAGIDELRDAEAIYLTSAGVGVARVSGFDSRRFAVDDCPIANLWPPAITEKG